MLSKYQKVLVVRLFLWLVTEISLGAIGLDNMADYSEFVFDEKRITHFSLIGKTAGLVKIGYWR